LFLTYNKHN